MIEKDLEKARNTPKTARKQVGKKALFRPEKVEKCTKKHFKIFAIRRLELGDEESHLNLKVAPQVKIFFIHGLKIIDRLKCANVLIKSDTFQ